MHTCSQSWSPVAHRSDTTGETRGGSAHHTHKRLHFSVKMLFPDHKDRPLAHSRELRRTHPKLDRVQIPHSQPRAVLLRPE